MNNIQLTNENRLKRYLDTLEIKYDMNILENNNICVRVYSGDIETVTIYARVLGLTERIIIDRACPENCNCCRVWLNIEREFSLEYDGVNHFTFN